jgi:hypothetical protein
MPGRGMSIPQGEAVDEGADLETALTLMSWRELVQYARAVISPSSTPARKRYDGPKPGSSVAA